MTATWRHSSGRVVGWSDDQQGHEQREVETEQPDQQMQPPPVERQPDDRQQVDDDQPGVGAALRVADDRDDGDVADRDDQPGPVGEPFPRDEEGRRDEREEEDAGDGDLAAGVVRERDDGDEHGADGHEREDGQPDAHRAGEADGQGCSGQSAARDALGSVPGSDWLAHRALER